MCMSKNCCKSLCSGLFSIGIAIFIYWLIFQPHQIRVYMDTATLSTFSLNTTSPPSLSYNINVTLSFRNPNRRIGVYYDSISADAFYDGTQLGDTDTNFDPFFQHRKTTKVVYPAFAGKQENVSNAVKDEFNKENTEGRYNVEVKLRSKLRHKLWFVKLRFKPKIKCLLRFPVMANGSASTAPFSKCKVDY